MAGPVATSRAARGLSDRPRGGFMESAPGSRPFRFGVVSGASTAEGWTRLVSRIEGLGYSTVFLSDHLDLGGAHPSTLSPLPALGSAAALTTRLRLGTSVLNQDF